MCKFPAVIINLEIKILQKSGAPIMQSPLRRAGSAKRTYLDGYGGSEFNLIENQVDQCTSL